MIGNGNSINFWDDHWLPCGPLRNCISSPIPLSHLNRSFSSYTNHLGSFDFSLLPFEVPLDIKHHIMGTPYDLSNSLTNSLSWSPNANGIFSTSFAYLSFFKDQQTLDLNWIWKSDLPPRYPLFIWQVFYNAIPTNSNLFIKNCIPNPLCALCNNAIEDLDHLFKTCPKVCVIWNLFSSFDSNRNLLFPAWLKYHCNHKKKFKYNVNQNSFFQVLLRNIWLARNNLIFNKKTFHS